MKQIAKDVGISLVATIVLSIIQNVSNWFTAILNANNGQIDISIADAVFYRSSNCSYASMLHYAAGIMIVFIAIALLIACFVRTMIVMSQTQDHKKNSSKEAKAAAKRKRLVNWLCVVAMFVISVFMFLYTSTFVIKPFKMWEQFELDLKVIAPYVEKGEIELLRSEWVLMKHQSDYDRIYEYICEVQRKQGIHCVEYSISEILEKGPNVNEQKPTPNE